MWIAEEVVVIVSTSAKKSARTARRRFGLTDCISIAFKQQKIKFFLLFSSNASDFFLCLVKFPHNFHADDQPPFSPFIFPRRVLALLFHSH